MFNTRLRELLQGLGVDNLQYFPCHIDNPIDGSSTDDYQVANIVGRVACVDFAKSVVEKFELAPDQLKSITKLSLVKSKLRGHDLFRLHEQPQVIVASDRVKLACEKQQISGVVFYDPEEYVF